MPPTIQLIAQPVIRIANVVGSSRGTDLNSSIFWVKELLVKYGVVKQTTLMVSTQTKYSDSASRFVYFAV